jgi:hypothetical protein
MIVVANKPGQLGNILYVYSNLIGRAIESDLKLANTALDNYADLFPATAGDLFCRFPPTKSRIRATRRRRRFIYHLVHFAARILSQLRLDLPFIRQITIRDWVTEINLGDPQFLAAAKPGQLLLLRGWLFRDIPAVQKHADEIRKFFRPREEYLQNVEAIIKRAREGVDVLVGVHIRHGILYYANVREYFYPTVRYVEMMHEIVGLFPNQRVGFLICSDWPQDPELFSRFRVSFGSNHLIEDLYAFARCDYLVGPPSTFTVWASFYGNVPLNVIRDPNQTQSIADFQVRLPSD